MSIRYECEGCGSVLKIKESLAGTKGKCPHCKFKFVVPLKGAESGVGLEAIADPEEEKPVTKAPAASAAETKSAPAKSPVPPPVAETAPPDEEPAAGENGFDLDAFLADESAPNAKASAGLSAPPPAPAAPAQPKYDKQGRRIFAPSVPKGATPEAQSGGEPSVEVPADLSPVKSAGLPQKERKPLIKFDFAGAPRQLRRSAIYIALGTILVGATAFLANRYFMPRLPLPVLYDVQGELKIDGKAVPNILVHLTPLEQPDMTGAGGKGMRLRDAVGATDESGLYRVQYIDGVYGAPMGRVRVWLEAINQADIKKIPLKYRTPGSPDIRNVREVNVGQFNLDLKTP